jgi:hypothetical protein
MGEMIRLKFIQQSASVSVWDGVTYDTSWQNNTTVDSDGYTVAHITSAEQAVTLWRENVVYNWQNSVSNRKIKIVLDTSVQFNANPDDWNNHPSDTWQYPLNTRNQGSFIFDGQYNSIIGLFCQTPTTDNRACFFNIECNSTIRNVRFNKCSSSINSGNARGNIAFVFSTLTLENVIFDRLYLYNRGSSYCQIGVNHWNGNGNTIYANNVVFSNVTVDVTRSQSCGDYSLLGGSITDWYSNLTQYLYADNIIYHNCTASTRTVYLIGNKSGVKTPTAQEYQITNVEYLDNTGLTANYGSEASSIDTMVSDYNAIASEDINSTGDGFDGAPTGDVEYYLLAPTDLAKGSGLRWEINIPMDLDFLYQAKDFDGTKIPNKAINPVFGDYLQAGTLTKNGSGSECYLSNASSQNNYLYVDLTASQLTAIKALAGTTYTWFFRVANTSGYGGIMSTRNGDSNFVYMFRSNGSQLQVHNSAGRDLGTNFTLSSENVFKVRISGSNYYAKNLTNGSEWSITDNYTKAMTNRMKTFYAGAGIGGSESILAAFYAMAGIPRDTTADEDEIMKNCLLNQSI